MNNLGIEFSIIKQVLKIAVKAGKATLDIYNNGFNIYIKDDNSPLTEADKASHDIITSGLNAIDDSIPILSEEGELPMYSERSSWLKYWLIDPLDGTKEFIKKSDQFTINIALMINNFPFFGVVYCPVLDDLYWGISSNKAYKIKKDKRTIPIQINTDISKSVNVAISRSHPSSKMDNFLSQFKKFDLFPIGSSLKICSVADGTVDLYPRLGPTMEWDTAAAHAIIRGSGGDLIKTGSSDTIIYNKENLLNPEFIAGDYKFIETLKH